MINRQSVLKEKVDNVWEQIDGTSGETEILRKSQNAGDQKHDKRNEIDGLINRDMVEERPSEIWIEFLKLKSEEKKTGKEWNRISKNCRATRKDGIYV